MAGRSASRLILFSIVLVVSRGAAAQDGRTTDLPEATPAPGAIAQPAPAAGLLSEPRLLKSAISLGFEKHGGSARTKEGFYPEVSNMITGAGFVSVGPGYRRYVFDRQAFIDASAAVSWHLYKMGQARVEAPQLWKTRLTLGAQTMWQDYTQVSYYGIGSESLDADESQYRVKSTDVVGYAVLRPRTTLSIGG